MRRLGAEHCDRRGCHALIRETAGLDGTVSLRLSAWREHAWPTHCEIAAIFARVLVVENAFCAPCTDCGRPRPAVFALADRIARESPDASGTRRISPDVPDDLRASVEALPAGKELPTFGGSAVRPYTNFESASAHPIALGGQAGVGVIGLGSFGWRDWPGYLAAIYARRSGALIPVAGFQLMWQRGPLRSVTITAP